MSECACSDCVAVRLKKGIYDYVIGDPLTDAEKAELADRLTVTGWR